MTKPPDHRRMWRQRAGHNLGRPRGSPGRAVHLCGKRSEGALGRNLEGIGPLGGGGAGRAGFFLGYFCSFLKHFVLFRKRKIKVECGPSTPLRMRGERGSGDPLHHFALCNLPIEPSLGREIMRLENHTVVRFLVRSQGGTRTQSC